MWFIKYDDCILLVFSNEYLGYNILKGSDNKHWLLNPHKRTESDYLQQVHQYYLKCAMTFIVCISSPNALLHRSDSLTIHSSKVTLCA